MIPESAQAIQKRKKELMKEVEAESAKPKLYLNEGKRFRPRVAKCIDMQDYKWNV